MKDPNTTPPDDSWESDAVWKLLGQAAPMKAHDRFAENTTRAARLLVKVQPWWSRLFFPAPLAGLAGATATVALAFAVISWVVPDATSVIPQNSAQAVAIEDIAAADTLLAAADHLDEFSDSELVSLIGF